ncbi:hypothetical protein [Pseudomonas sp. MF7448]|uniref:hypothetical protein n=1 Tax=Pseudomonas sp. MF7448 TaxID=2797537 RepID=UPI002D8004B6|nr:hypothetical protein [Pseudomonas sp. MF7448]
MSKPFDMELFLVSVLTGSHTPRQRHLRQVKAIQTAIAERWQHDNPWTWRRKHLAWFLNHYVSRHAESTRYYYLLTVHLLAHRLGKSWQFNRQAKVNNRPILLKKSDFQQAWTQARLPSENLLTTFSGFSALR